MTEDWTFVTKKKEKKAQTKSYHHMVQYEESTIEANLIVLDMYDGDQHTYLYMLADDANKSEKVKYIYHTGTSCHTGDSFDIFLECEEIVTDNIPISCKYNQGETPPQNQ